MPCAHFQSGRSSLLLLTLFLYPPTKYCSVEARTIIVPLAGQGAFCCQSVQQRQLWLLWSLSTLPCTAQS